MIKYFLFFLFFCVNGCQQHKQEWSYSSFFWGFAVEGFPIDQQTLQSTSVANIVPEMIVFYLQWPSSPNEYQPINSSLEAIWNSGAVPCLTWEPMTIVDQGEKFIPYEDILSGKYDIYLSSMAEEIKKWQKPVVIRFAQEMNLERYHWGTSKEDFGPRSPEIYIKIYQYVVDLFRSRKVHNVLWAFCPNVDSIPNEAWNRAKEYYPGDSYVDIFGMDGYNWSINEKVASSRNLSILIPWRSFEQIFEPLYRELKAISPYKPIIVFETASVTRLGDPKKSLWIKDAIQVVKKWGIKGIIWFQVKKEEDWRINQEDDLSALSLVPHEHSSFQIWLVNYLQTTPMILNK